MAAMTLHPEDQQQTAKRYSVWVGFMADGETHPIGSVTVQAQNEEEAKKIGMDELWDGRLDAASCIPTVRAERIDEEEPGTKHVCDNCGRTFSKEQLARIERLEERIEAGAIVPSGQCPDCGALCYLQESPGARRPGPPTRIIIHVRGGVAEGVSCSDAAASVSVADWDDAAVDDRARAECERLEEEAKKLHEVY
jgi:hypothetical protein